MSTLIQAGAERLFVFAGNSIFTIKSEVTGKHFTYKVAQTDKYSYNVYLLSENDNKSDYEFLGWTYSENESRLRLSNLNYTKDSIQIKALNYFLANLDDIPKKLKVFHEERCGCCGRRLTTPESIELGYGPKCYKRAQRRAYY